MAESEARVPETERGWKHIPMEDLKRQMDEHFNRECDLFTEILTGDYTPEEFRELITLMNTHPLNHFKKFLRTWKTNSFESAVDSLSATIAEHSASLK